MDSFIQRCVRMASSALILAGIIIAVGILLHPDETAASFVPGAAWQVVHVALGIAFLAAVFGFGGLHLKLGERAGGFGEFIFTLAIALNALFSGLILYFEGLLVPAVAKGEFAAVLDPKGALFAGTFGTWLTASFALYAVVMVLLGIIIVRMRIPLWWGGVLLLAAPLVAFAPPLPHLVGVLGGVLLGVGHVVLGLSMQRTK